MAVASKLSCICIVRILCFRSREWQKLIVNDIVCVLYDHRVADQLIVNDIVCVLYDHRVADQLIVNDIVFVLYDICIID